MKSFIKITFTLFVFSLFYLSVEAQVTLTLERVSDTEVILTATGTTTAPQPPQRSARFGLHDVTNGATSSINFSDNTLEAGGFPLTGNNFFTTGNPNPTFVLLFGSNLPANSIVSGSVTITITGTTWKNVGATGDFWWGYNNSLIWTNNVGDYSIVPYTPPPTVPTLSQWGLIILAISLMTFGTLHLISRESGKTA